ncbi:uncharacterized protein TNCV_2280171 [Trichonephila clavipes]|nr:uncharacterized protein TNCV_2280171 [Trichonephila clavipes]
MSIMAADILVLQTRGQTMENDPEDTRTVSNPEASHLLSSIKLDIKIGKMQLNIQEALDLLQNLPSEICDVLTEEEIPANNLLEFSLTITVERHLSERLLTGVSNIRTRFFLSTTCTVYKYVSEQCNAQQLFRVRPKVTGKPKVRDFEEFQLCDWALNSEIVTSVQEDFDPVVDEAGEDEDNNHESSKGPSNADTFSTLETAMEWYEQQSECCPTQLLLLKRIRDLATKKRKYTMVQRKIRDYFAKFKLRHFAPILLFRQARFPHVMILNICIVFSFIYSIDRIWISGIRTIAYPNGVRSQLIRINDVLLY